MPIKIDKPYHSKDFYELNLKEHDIVRSSVYGEGVVRNVYVASHAGFNWGIKFPKFEYLIYYNKHGVALGETHSTLEVEFNLIYDRSK